jgi:hypothetical protein
MKGLLLVSLVAGAIPMQAAAQSNVPVPELEGFYVVADHGLVALHETKQTQRFAFAQAGVFGFTEVSDVRVTSARPAFIAYGVTAPDRIMRLVRKPAYRDSLWGQIPALWIVSRTTRLRVERVAGREGMRRLVPESDLVPGVYAVPGPSFLGAYTLEIVQASSAMAMPPGSSPVTLAVSDSDGGDPPGILGPYSGRSSRRSMYIPGPWVADP